MDNNTEKTYWRSSKARDNDPSIKSYVENEFQEGASLLEEGVSRRGFLKLMGGTLALAGLSGCDLIRRPEETLYPYAKMPEYVVPGEGVYYATTFANKEDVVGVLVESHSGRPIKIEGNPLHPMSQGALLSHHQASILDLYDPDRSQHVLKNGQKQSKEAFVSFINGLRSQWKKNKGHGLALLYESQSSPSFYRQLALLRKQFPKAKIYRYDSANQENVYEGLHMVTGRPLMPRYNFSKADIVLTFGDDFLGNGPSAIANTKAFSERRDPDNAMNRLYVFEHRFTITGAKADHRIRLRASDIRPFFWYLTHRLIKKDIIPESSVPKALLSQIVSGSTVGTKLVSQAVIDAIIDDLKHHKGRSLFVVGQMHAPDVHALCFLVNKWLGNEGHTVSYRYRNFSSEASLSQSSVDAITELSEHINKGDIDTLMIIGGNPVVNSPADISFSKLLGKVPHRIHLSAYENETSRLCQWSLAYTHYLEKWGDAQAQDGTYSIIQPLIQPLYESFCENELLSVLRGRYQKNKEIVKQTFQVVIRPKALIPWKKALHNGVASSADPGRKYRMTSTKVLRSQIKSAISDVKKKKSSEIEGVFVESYAIHSGQYINNSWLQELPDPITKLTWDNAVLLSPKQAKEMHVDSGDMVSIQVDDHKLSSVVFVLPGHADRSLTFILGYGQAVGRIGKDTGFRVEDLRRSEAFTITEITSVTPLGKTYPLASTQEQGSMEGRHLYREADIKDYTADKSIIKKVDHEDNFTSSWNEKTYEKGYQWGMTIDLGRCTGCSACTIACQAENNIPSVGKEGVEKGREMHWIRIDRYFEGDENDPDLVEQPVTCLQCELAPCEQVCPVSATVHSEEGLNDMVYNRCIGTRYCLDNCPAKVRRFNFFDYHQRDPRAVKKDRKHFFDYIEEPAKTMKMQFNPDVTVRMRGVMEKCTYCVQRINAVKHQSKNEGRDVQDLEIQTACMQTCPSNAIVFGNINDPKSRVSQLKEKHRDYRILNELHLKARTSYLASIRNEHPILKKKDVNKETHESRNHH